ncbi:MAG: hypothetical protein B7Z16_09755 [Algoriphagus sp. 32-45-6]|nr:MAG: hypothetical protein B7Z16_09755 [Algoriphagus sp. 32-45-6]
MALGLLLQLKFNHLQITYYTLIISVIYVLVRLVFDWKKEGIGSLSKTIGFLVIGAVLAVGGNLGRLATALEYSPYSTRGKATLESTSSGLDKDYAFGWSNGILETLTLVVPDFYGGGSNTPLPKDSASEKALRAQGLDPAQINGFIQGAPTYWGDQPFTGGPIYGSVILVFLAVLGIWAAPKESLTTFGTIIVLSLMLSWGKNLAWFNYLLFDILPGYNKFRAVSMALGMTLFAVPVLGMISLERLVKTKELKPLLISGGIVAGLTLILAVAAGAFFRFEGAADANFPDWLVTAMKADRKSMLSASAWKSFAFVALAIGLIYFYLKGKISELILGAGLIALITMDVWTINRRYLNAESFQGNPSRQFFAETPAEQSLAQDQGYFRVLPLTEGLTQGARTSYRFNSLGGYHGAKLRRYQDLVDNRLQFELQEFVKKAQEGTFDWESIGTINMLNTKYLIAGNEANGIFENPEANGPAWVPTQVVPVTSNQAEMDQLGQINTKTEATLNTQEFGEVMAGSGVVNLTSHSPNELKYQAKMAQGGLVVFSEIHYPEGWTATIDGQEAKILRVNYLLRGLEIPQGSHEIVFTFAPSSYYATKAQPTLTEGSCSAPVARSIYPTSPPFTATLYNDGSVLKLGTVFYSNTSSFSITGGKVYVPWAFTGSDLTIFYVVGFNDTGVLRQPVWSEVPSGIPGQFVTIPGASVVEGWNTVTFPNSATIQPFSQGVDGTSVWIGYYFADGTHYIHAPSPGASAIQSSSGVNLFIGGTNFNGDRGRSAYSYDNGGGEWTNALYGIDIVTQGL